jgi:hypothetical protein
MLHHRGTLSAGLLTGNVCGKCVEGHKCSTSVCVEKVVGAAQEAVTRSLRESV